MSKLIDLTGKRFHFLLVIARIPGYPVKFLCRCDCGVVKEYYGQALRIGATRSCGCFRRKHGLENTAEYTLWASMKTRCYNKKAANYKWYGGRGIKVCKRWHTFKNFMQDMLPRTGATLDRIDSNGDYSPKNCRWTDWKTQQRNRRNTRFVKVFGQRYTLSELVKKYSLPSTVYKIVAKGGDIETYIREIERRKHE